MENGPPEDVFPGYSIAMLVCQRVHVLGTSDSQLVQPLSPTHSSTPRLVSSHFDFAKIQITTSLMVKCKHLRGLVSNNFAIRFLKE